MELRLGLEDFRLIGQHTVEQRDLIKRSRLCILYIETIGGNVWTARKGCPYATNTLPGVYLEFPGGRRIDLCIHDAYD